ncbi:MAG: adenylate kinase [Candidatus Parcubacteria bacterium]|jgi:adenylate kinase family enzyme
MARKILGVLATGPSGNGKTTFFELLKGLVRPKHGEHIVGNIDMSSILIRWGMNQTSALGDELRAHYHLIEEGRLIPDCLVVKTFKAWYAEVTMESDLQVLLLSGAPRSVEQLTIMDSFVNAMAISINATREQSNASILERIRRSGRKLRVDDVGGKVVADERWSEYQLHTIPAIGKLNGNGLHLDRSEPLTARLRKTLEHMQARSGPIPLSMIQTGLNRLDAPEHPIHKRIYAVEHPVFAKD